MATVDANGHQKFGAFSRIMYELNGENAGMATYDMHGNPYTAGRRLLKPGAVPVLFFQMVEAGYLLKKESVQGKITTVLAFSPEWMDAKRDEYERDGKL